MPTKKSVGPTFLSANNFGVRAAPAASSLFSRFLSSWDRSIETALDLAGPKPACALTWNGPFTLFDRLSFYHTDHLGSVRVVTDRDGNLFERTDYSPFDEISNDDLYPPAGSSHDPDDNYDRHREKFTSQQWDYRSRLYYCGVRHYDPETGRFTCADTNVPNPGHPPKIYRDCFQPRSWQGQSRLVMQSGEIWGVFWRDQKTGLPL